MKTIARNRAKKIAEIAAAVTSVRYYDQSSGNMVPGTIEGALGTLHRHDSARLIDNENGTYTVTVHSNYWYDLDTRPQAAPEQAEKPAADIAEDARRREVRNAATLARTVSIHDLGKTAPATTTPAGKPLGVQVATTERTRFRTGDPVGDLLAEIDATPVNADGSVTLPGLGGSSDATHPLGGQDEYAEAPVVDVERAHLLALTWNMLVDFANTYGETPETLGARAVNEPWEGLATMEHAPDGYVFTELGWAGHRMREIAAAWDAAHAEQTRRGVALLSRGDELMTHSATATVAELTRRERRALRNGVTKPAARSALDGLRLRSLVAGGKGDGPLRLTAMGTAVKALLKGASVAV